VIRSFCVAASIVLIGGSIACAESHSEEGVEALPANGKPVSSSSLRLALVGEASDPTGVTLQGLSLDLEAVQALNKFSLDDWKRVFPVYVVPAEETLNSSIPPMSGRYSVDGDLLRFEPLFGFEKGVEYLSKFKASVFSLRLKRKGVSTRNESHNGDVQLGFSAKANRVKPPTELVAVYPSVSSLPENLLKFYLHFSQPMTWGTYYQYIHLLRKDGTEIEAPFLQLDEELWDPSGKRMTILIDPGRIKSGLVPRDEVGPALESGKEFQLLIDSRWPDAEGLPLVEGFVKSFRVTDPDVLRPTMSTWSLDLPKANTNEPFELAFPEPLDHALLQRVVWVADHEGMEIEGEVRIDLGETRWRFFPSKNWRAGIYQLCAENSLEDLAGNSLGRLFEVDSFLTVSRRVERETVKLTFQINALP
jgi:hypothetical protein